MTPALFLAGMVAMGAALCWCAVRAWRVLEARPLRPLEAWVGRLAAVAVMAMPLLADAGALPGPRAVSFTGGTVANAVVLTGDNANGTGTLRIRPSDEDTQLVLCEASNNASPEVCSSLHHINASSTTSFVEMTGNAYLDSSGNYQRYNTNMGYGSLYSQVGTVNTSNVIGGTLWSTNGTVSGDWSIQVTGAGTSTFSTGTVGTVTNDFRGKITNGGSATCNGIGAGSVCVNDPAVFYDASGTYTAYFGSSAANSSTQIWEYTQGTAGQATTLFATGTMASPTVAAGVGYYGSTYTDADYSDKAVFSGIGKEVVSNRTDNVAAGSVHSRWVEDSSASSTLAGTTLMTLLGDGTVKPTMYGSQTNCSDGAGAAACSAAPAGSVVIDDGATTVVVSTTAVTANSQILVTFDSSLGTKLGVTCNTTYVDPYVTARTAATSFTIAAADPAGANPACFSYFIVN